MSDVPAVTRVSATEEVARLAAEILDPERRKPIVCVTSPTWASEPLIDVSMLARSLAGAASIYVMPTGELSWELTARLPPRLDVYGGATRVWWPGVDYSADPFAHPLFLVHGHASSDVTVAKIVDAFRRRGLIPDPSVERPQAGSEAAAVVTAVRAWGAELTLAGGQPAFAHRSQLTRVDWLEPDRVVRAGQAVRVQILDPAPERARMSVSLLPFEPEPWQRLVDQYPERALVEGIVLEFRNFGAFVEVYPGLSGLLHRRQISREWVSHPEDFLQLDERLVVELLRIDPQEEKIELSLLDIPEGAKPHPAAAIYPDGPPWLPAPGEEPPPPERETRPGPEAAETRPQPPLGDEVPSDQPSDEAEQPGEAPAASAAAAGVPPGEADAAAGAPSEGEQPPTGGGGSEELERLERTIEDALDLQSHVGALFEGSERRLRELRAEAAQIRQLLQRDLAEARLRLLEFAEQESAAVTGSTESALADARAELEELSERLLAAEADRRELLERLRDERRRADEADRRVSRIRGELRSERETSARRDRELALLDPSGGERFLAGVRLAWERLTTPDDQRRFPWQEPALGPEFLRSLTDVQGVSRERVEDVCAHVASGRAPDIPGLEVHPLRVSEVGGASQRVREDGAKAWRCSLQASTPAARRLHYWKLPDGGVELAKIVYHDDFSIS